MKYHSSLKRCAAREKFPKTGGSVRVTVFETWLFSQKVNDAGVRGLSDALNEFRPRASLPESTLTVQDSIACGFSRTRASPGTKCLVRPAKQRISYIGI